jgi:hypothetical protein
MELIEGVALSKLCDYSFGDQSGQWGRIYTSFMKEANSTNTEFISTLFEIKKSRDYMTLFIDNIRLYKRHIVEVSESDRPYIDSLHEKNDLLHLCSCFPDMKFIIFTNLEDTPTDNYIFDLIPDNVLSVIAVNAISHGGKVIPAPYGIQRKMHPNDIRDEYLRFAMQNTYAHHAKKLLYTSHNENSHTDRKGTLQMFVNKEWATVDSQRVNYDEFLIQLRNHQFVLCPRGNAIDCHRNWEVLYMRRVPVMKRYSYLEELYKDFPVLFVDDYSEVTENLLLESEELFVRAQSLDLIYLSLPHWFEKMCLQARFGKVNNSHHYIEEDWEE